MPKAKPPIPRPRVVTWRHQLHRDLTLLDAWRQGRATLDDLAPAATRLVDSRYRAELAGELARLAPDDIEDRAGLAYAVGCLKLGEGDHTAAMRWLAQAQAVLDPAARSLAARLAFELGYLYLVQSRSVTADAVLAWAEGLYANTSAASADLLHLRALAAEDMGDHVRARGLYRMALESSAEALTPLTRALATINLAVSLNHVDPAESLALTEFAGQLVEAAHLDRRLRPTISNVQAYALICLGRTPDARAAAARATMEARKVGHRRVALYAGFNTAIIDELEGSPDAARDRLLEVQDASRAEGFTDLEGWASLRLAWLRLRAGDPSGARRLLDDAHARLLSTRYAEALRTLKALINLEEHRYPEARVELEGALRSATQRGDLLSEFVLLLWLAYLERLVGRDRVAGRLGRRALTLASTHDFRWSPNWWSAEVVRSAQTHAPDRAADAARLIASAGEADRAREQSTVEIFGDGRVLVDGCVLDPERWRVGRTGSHVLQRLFGLLVTSYPSPLRRDELAERLWPASDGDRAIRNLYAATVDLRRLLAGVPGVVLAVDDSGYCLFFDGNVRLTEQAARG